MFTETYPLARLKIAFQRGLIRHGLKTPYNISIHQDDGSIHIYTDGSFSLGKQKIGAGWVIKTSKPNDEILLCETFPRVTTPEKQEIPEGVQGKAAEIIAVTRALETLPIDSKVVLHTDFQEIINFVNDDTLRETPYNFALRNQFKDLANALSWHTSVTALLRNDKTSKRNNISDDKRIMRLAHNLAAHASGARTQKELLNGDESKYAGLFPVPKGTHRATTEDALSVDKEMTLKDDGPFGLFID